jgi:hypothetical protein
MEEELKERRWKAAGKAFLYAAIALATLIAIGTIYALLAGTRDRKLAAESLAGLELAEGDSSISLGSLRFSPIDDAAAVYGAELVVAWDASDAQLAAEILAKRAELAAAAMTYLSSLESERLDPSAIGAVKASLRQLLSAKLTLGAIDEVFLPKFQRF